MQPDTEPTKHAYRQWSILTTLIPQGNLKVTVDGWEDGKPKRWEKDLLEFVKAHSNSINIFWCSAYGDAHNETELKNWILKDDILDLRNEKNFAIFAAGTNIEIDNGVVLNKIHSIEYKCDEH